MNEQEFVAWQFQKAFAKWKDKPFVLYGLGKNTEAILKRVDGFQFAGLMDAGNIGKQFWGLQVLSEEEVVGLKPKIVIVARESVVPVIYARIHYLHSEYGIEVYNFKGELLGQKESEYHNQNLLYWNLSEKKLRESIRMHDYISFDIFDTLLMRRVLQPEDVFKIVERILEKRGYSRNEFCRCRTQAANLLTGYPTIHEIYEQIGRQCGLSWSILKEWMELEIWVEERVLVPRKKMIELFQYALNQGKKVFLISDMYFTKKQIEDFLCKYGVKGYSGLLVSCDHHRSKEDGSLFIYYRQLTAGRNYLHIGDNRRSDGERAHEQGIDTFQIYSAYEIWMASSMQTTLSYLESLEERCILGNLVWRCCENPFVFNKDRGMFTINTPEKLGYVFLGALYDEFILWLLEVLKEENVEELILPSRDGFLIQKMLEQEREIPFEYIYLKASRRAVSVAAIKNKKDILFLLERIFQGTFGELLWQRYGIVPKENDKVKDLQIKEFGKKRAQKYILSYQNEILKNAEKERNDYISYMHSIKFGKKKKQAIFDFVASGTIQFFMQKLLSCSLKGVYFATMNHPNEKYFLEDCIVSAYGNVTSYNCQNQVAKHYLFLETIMIDNCSTFRCVEDGKLIYEPQENNNFSVVCKVQEGILNYQRDMKQIRELLPYWNDARKFADALFGKLFDGSCQVKQDIKKGFFNDDVFDGVKAYPVWNT
jgi:predicted HAD superfamily hydrolase